MPEHSLCTKKRKSRSCGAALVEGIGARGHVREAQGLAVHAVLRPDTESFSLVPKQAFYLLSACRSAHEFDRSALRCLCPLQRLPFQPECMHVGKLRQARHLACGTSARNEEVKKRITSRMSVLGSNSLGRARFCDGSEPMATGMQCPTFYLDLAFNEVLRSHQVPRMRGASPQSRCLKCQLHPLHQLLTATDCPQADTPTERVPSL